MTVSITGLSCCICPQWPVYVTNPELLPDFSRKKKNVFLAPVERLINSFDSIAQDEADTIRNQDTIITKSRLEQSIWVQTLLKKEAVMRLKEMHFSVLKAHCTLKMSLLPFLCYSFPQELVSAIYLLCQFPVY